MNYRYDKYNNKISLLGFGCMRFQKTMGKIDMEKAEKQIMDAFHGGVNYYDTAYVYPGSEAAIGEIFEKFSFILFKFREFLLNKFWCNKCFDNVKLYWYFFIVNVIFGL